MIDLIKDNDRFKEFFFPSQSLRRYETSKAKLEGQERQLNAQLSKQLKLNEELRRKG